MKKIFRSVNLFSNFILITLLYLAGIGAISILARIFGKDFLNLKTNKSSWEAYEKNIRLDKMY